MTECVWSYAEWTPYEVLRVPSNASISDIRVAFKKMALYTHPDKQRGLRSTAPDAAAADHSSGAAVPSPVSSARAPAPISFHAVKAASEVLLDPFLRAAYDATRSHALVREVGAISDTFSLADDFELVDSAVAGEGAQVRVFQCECRCGGVYEVMLFDESAATAAESRLRTLRCECDSCSLVVEVIVK